MRNHWLLTLLVLIGICWNVAAQQRGGENEEGAVEIVDARSTVTALGKQWAVFIAIDEYREWGPLEYPVKDAQEIKNILLEHYYIDEIRELYNREATASAIRRLFIELKENTGPNDSVFVFHAGHGIREDKTKTYAWLPHDGGREWDAQSGWLSHVQIRSMLDSLPARHVFLISDSCYSGDLLAARRGRPETIVSYPAAYDRVSRQVMASGASGEEVDDVSEFASRLKNTLLRTETPYITPDFLFYHISYVDTMRRLSTMPNIAAIPESQHEIGGSFLFFRRNPSVPQPPVLTETDLVTVLPPEQATDDQQEGKGLPGEYGYFIGSWIATVEHDNSFDTYEINLSANGRCTVKITNDIAEQETTGNWSWDGSMFRLSAVFRNPAIAYQQNIQWVSLVSFGSGNNAFNILGRAAVNGSPVRFTFFRNN